MTALHPAGMAMGGFHGMVVMRRVLPCGPKSYRAMSVCRSVKQPLSRQRRQPPLAIFKPIWIRSPTGVWPPNLL